MRRNFSQMYQVRSECFVDLLGTFFSDFSTNLLSLFMYKCSKYHLKTQHFSPGTHTVRYSSAKVAEARKQIRSCSPAVRKSEVQTRGLKDKLDGNTFYCIHKLLSSFIRSKQQLT